MRRTTEGKRGLKTAVLSAVVASVLMCLSQAAHAVYYDIGTVTNRYGGNSLDFRIDGDPSAIKRVYLIFYSGKDKDSEIAQFTKSEWKQLCQYMEEAARRCQRLPVGANDVVGNVGRVSVQAIHDDHFGYGVYLCLVSKKDYWVWVLADDWNNVLLKIIQRINHMLG